MVDESRTETAGTGSDRRVVDPVYAMNTRTSNFCGCLECVFLCFGLPVVSLVAHLVLTPLEPQSRLGTKLLKI